MTLRIGTGGDADKLYVGSDVVQKVYQGSTLVWSAVTTNTYTATFNEFADSVMLFDSGAAQGLNRAIIPISGNTTAVAGVVMQARLIRSDTLASVHDWTDMTGLSNGTTYSSVLTISTGARSQYDLFVEVRPKDSTATPARSTGEVRIGHKVALWTQSEIAYWLSSANTPANTTAVLPADDRVRVMDRTATPSFLSLTSANYKSGIHTTAITSFATALITEAPNDFFDIVFQSRAATSQEEMTDDADAGRDWSLDKTVADAAAGGVDGGVAPPGLSVHSWWNGTLFKGTFAEAMHPLYTGKLIDGTPISAGTVVTTTDGSITYDHNLTEVYTDSSLTKHAFWSHLEATNIPQITYGFGSGAGGSKSTIQADMRETEVQTTLIGTPTMAEWVADKPRVHDASTFDIWGDATHPDATENGICTMARLGAYGILDVLGIAGRTMPTIVPTWGASKVVVSSPEGDLTTQAAVNGEGALSGAVTNNPAHHTDFIGFTLNRMPVERAEVGSTSGTIDIFPLGAATFDGLDKIQWMQDTAPDLIASDRTENIQRYLPIVSQGETGLDGLPPLMGRSFQSTLAAPAQWTTDATGPYLSLNGALNGYANEDQFTFAADVTKPVGSSAGDILLFMGDVRSVSLTYSSNGGFVVTVYDSDSTDLVGTSVRTSNWVWHEGYRNRIVLSVDLNGGVATGSYVRLWCNGALVIDQELLDNSGLFLTTRMFVGSGKNGASRGDQELRYLRYAWEATTDGSDPAGGWLVDVTGDASAINNAPNKAGGTAT